jgi:hypothetical protein
MLAAAVPGAVSEDRVSSPSGSVSMFPVQPDSHGEAKPSTAVVHMAQSITRQCCIRVSAIQLALAATRPFRHAIRVRVTETQSCRQC